MMYSGGRYQRGAEAARAKAVQLQIWKAGTEGEIDAAFGTLMQLQADALVVGPDVSCTADASSSSHWRHAMDPSDS